MCRRIRDYELIDITIRDPVSTTYYALEIKSLVSVWMKASLSMSPKGTEDALNETRLMVTHFGDIQ
jgi:hypothetical protein